MTYSDFIARKSATRASPGLDLSGELHPAMFDHQRDVTRWALKRGRAALFLDTGLGKSLCQLVWAREVCKATGGRAIILAPLAVGEQTVAEAKRWGIDSVEYHRSQAESAGCDIVVTNYEMLSHFDPRQFVAVVLDESSILKSQSGATRKALTEAFSETPFRLCCTATPSPNDFTELGNHSEFLGVKPQKDMLAEFFVHDGANRALNTHEVEGVRGGVRASGDWRLKGHAEDSFWRWVCTWGALVRKPSDLGYPDGGYELPELRMHEHIIPADHDEARERGLLFASDAVTLLEQRRVRRATLQKRADVAARLAGGPDDGPCLVWCELNDEADAVTKAIPGAVQVAGADTNEDKASRMLGFADGTGARVLVSKVACCGFGMNFQRCARMVFVGASHSYEGTYQAIRRCWRFGQTQPVDVHIIRAETEGAIVKNYQRKAADAERMAVEMGARMREVMASEVRGAEREWRRHEAGRSVQLPEWLR